MNEHRSEHASRTASNFKNVKLIAPYPFLHHFPRLQLFSRQHQKSLSPLRSKPFVIISGISGTGKTKIVQLFAESMGATEENGQFKLIPVRPDWSDSSELLGYADLKGEFRRDL